MIKLYVLTSGLTVAVNEIIKNNEATWHHPHTVIMTPDGRLAVTPLVPFGKGVITDVSRHVTVGEVDDPEIIEQFTELLKRIKAQESGLIMANASDLTALGNK